MPKKYNTPHRSVVVKTRLNEEEHTEFLKRLNLYNMSQAEFIRQAIHQPLCHNMLSRKPMIITTNIALSAMQKATDLDDRRIYDRILEVCVPVLFNGENFRKGTASENLKKAARILNNNENGGT